MGLLVMGSAPLAASAHAAVLPVFEVSQRLIEERVAPAPLIPTYVPPALVRGRGFIEPGYARGKAYSLRMLHQGPGGTDGVISLERCQPIGSAAFGRCTGLAATRRDYVRQGFISRPTRVRGTSGFLLTRKASDGPDRSLIWREGGVVYSIGSGTPKKVSLRELRATAAGLDRLQNRYLGSSPDPENSSEALLVTSERFVAGFVQWQAACGGPSGTIRAGSADLALVARRGNAFAFDIGQAASDSARGWAGRISGVVGPAAIVLNISATGVFDGLSCDTGALALNLGRFDQSSPGG